MMARNIIAGVSGACVAGVIAVAMAIHWHLDFTTGFLIGCGLGAVFTNVSIALLGSFR